MAIPWKVLFASVAVLLVSLASGVQAFPSSGANCTSCHSTPNGTFNVLPSNLIELFPAQAGQVTFNVTDIPAGATAAIGVDGLDAANLMATVGAGWTSRGGGNWHTSSTFTTTPQSIVLPFTLGGGAVPGDYSIDARLAGTDGWSTLRNFTIRVVIPEPTTIALVGFTALSGMILVGRGFQRRKTIKFQRGRFT